MFQILVYAILFLSRCDALPDWLVGDMEATAEYLTVLYSKYERDHGARDILYHLTTALRLDFFSKELAFNHVPKSYEIVSENFWQMKPQLFDLSNHPPRAKKRFTSVESDLIGEMRLTLPDPPELIPPGPNQPDLDPGQYRNYKPLVVESVILHYAHSTNADHEVAECVKRIKHGLSHLDPFRYIYYESLQLYNLANRVYRKNLHNPIAIIVLKLLFSGIDGFITGASEDLIGENWSDRLSLSTLRVGAQRFPLGVRKIRKKDIREAKKTVESVLADVSRGLELFETQYTKPGVGHYSIATRHHLEEQRNRIPQVNIVALYQGVEWDPDSQETFEELMKSILKVGNNSRV